MPPFSFAVSFRTRVLFIFRFGYLTRVNLAGALQGITKKQRLSLCFFLINLCLSNYRRRPNQADLHVYLVQ